MENNRSQLVCPTAKCSEQHEQVFVIDGCTVKVQFLQDKTVDNTESTLDSIRSILFSSELVK